MPSELMFRPEPGRVRSLNRALAAALAAALLLGLAASPNASDEVAAAGRELISVIVREKPGAGVRPERLVKKLGGVPGRQIGIIDGFEASVPAEAVDRLSEAPSVHSVTPNGKVQMQSHHHYPEGGELGSMFRQHVVGQHVVGRRMGILITRRQM